MDAYKIIKYLSLSLFFLPAMGAFAQPPHSSNIQNSSGKQSDLESVHDTESHEKKPGCNWGDSDNC